MSAIELAEKIESLNSEDYNMIIMLVDRLASKQQFFLPKLSEDELVKQLTESIDRSNNGHTKSAREVSNAMRSKYGL